MGDSSYLEGLGRYLNILSFGLPLESFYDDLNFNETDLDSFYGECKSLYSEKKYFDNKRLCSILLRFLKKSSTRTKNKNSDYDDCILFNYWMYGELEKKYIHKGNSYFYHAFAELQSIWNSLIYEQSKKDYYDKCNPDNSIVSQGDWKKRRDLYDYCVNYELLQGEIKSYEQNCRHYYAYIKSNAPLYEHFNKRCLSADKSKCPDFYNKCKDYDPVKVLSNLPCYEKMRKQEATAMEGALPVETHLGLQVGATFSSDDSQLQRENTPPVTKAGNVLLGVVVTSMTSGALYKFTPLGNMLRNRFGWSNNMSNMHAGDNGLFYYGPESFNPYSGGAEEHYIGYQPA